MHEKSRANRGGGWPPGRPPPSESATVFQASEINNGLSRRHARIIVSLFQQFGESENWVNVSVTFGFVQYFV